MRNFTLLPNPPYLQVLDEFDVDINDLGWHIPDAKALASFLSIPLLMGLPIFSVCFPPLSPFFPLNHPPFCFLRRKTHIRNQTVDYNYLVNDINEALAYTRAIVDILFPYSSSPNAYSFGGDVTLAEASIQNSQSYSFVYDAGDVGTLYIDLLSRAYAHLLGNMTSFLAFAGEGRFIPEPRAPLSSLRIQESEVEDLGVGVNTYVVSRVLKERGWSATALYYQGRPFYEEDCEELWQPAVRGVCFLADGVVRFRSRITWWVYELQAPVNATVSKRRVMEAVFKEGWASPDWLFDGPFDCMKDGDVGGPVARWEEPEVRPPDWEGNDGVVSVGCVSALPIFRECGGECPVVVEEGGECPFQEREGC